MQRTAQKFLSFSVLSLAIGSGVSWAQLSEAEPVTVTTAMAPQLVPAAQVISQPATISIPAQSDDNPGFTVQGAATGIGGSNPGNANTGGVQVQSVNVQASPVIDASSGRSDIARRERLRRELENENRLMEKIELGRLEDESERSKSIEGFQSSLVSAQASAVASAPVVQTMPVSAVGAGAVATGYGEAIAIAGVSTSGSSLGSLGTVIRFSPFAGYRWLSNNYAELQARNRFITGAKLEGQLNQYIGLEAGFTYGYDEFRSNYYNVGVPYAYGVQQNCQGYTGACNDMFRARRTYEFDTGLKLGFMTGSVRPFGSVGLAAQFQKYLIDNIYTTQQAEAAGFIRATTNVLANFGGGLDLRIASNFSVGARYTYQAVLTRKSYSNMNRIYGDDMNRHSVQGNLQLVF